ncbi:MAG: UDP-glucose 6-dehydrogenase, partial [Granulosicoccaceae bacterium]
MNITVFGSGYVGLVTGALLADVGNTLSSVNQLLDSSKVGIKNTFDN